MDNAAKLLDTRTAEKALQLSKANVWKKNAGPTCIIIITTRIIIGISFLRVSLIIIIVAIIISRIAVVVTVKGVMIHPPIHYTKSYRSYVSVLPPSPMLFLALVLFIIIIVNI